MNGGILALDLATTTGWCEGLPGETPIHGSSRLAPPSSPSPAVHGGLLDFLAKRLTAFRYRAVVYEAPLDPRWKGAMTNTATARILLGLPAVVEAVCYQTGTPVREATSGDVRKHMLGCRPKSAEAKPMVLARAREMGFDPRDDNAADALMIWHYACALLAPKEARDTTPLMARAKR